MKLFGPIAMALLGAIGLSEPPPREQIQASYEAHRGDFDYLLGDWEFTSTSREYGKFSGSWSAFRLGQGQVLDEYRVVGENGEVYYSTTILRAFNAALERWELVGMDPGTGLQNVGTGRRIDGEMHIEQTLSRMGEKPSLWRIRYYNIQPGRFSWSGDRSTDGGQTWVKDYQRIEARRTGPARSLEPLARGKQR